MASVGGGPAFQVAAGEAPAGGVAEGLEEATTCRDVDNDVVMSQRPSKFRDGVSPPFKLLETLPSPHELFPWEYAMSANLPQTPGIALGCPRSCFPQRCA